MINKILTELDNFIENMRNLGVSDKMIALNLCAAAGLLKQKKWDDFYSSLPSIKRQNQKHKKQ